MAPLRCLGFAALVVLAGCGNGKQVDIWEQLAAPSYAGNPKRIFVSGQLDPAFHQTFAALIGQCGAETIARPWHQTPPLDDPQARQAMAAFHADALLTIRLNSEQFNSRTGPYDTYVVTLTDLGAGREAWKGLYLDTPRDPARFAAEISMFLKRDHVLQDCPAVAKGSPDSPEIADVLETVNGRLRLVR